MANIGRTRRGRPEPIKSKNYNELSRKIDKLQDLRSALYENDDLTDEQLSELEKPINEEISSLIDKLYL